MASVGQQVAPATARSRTTADLVVMVDDEGRPAGTMDKLAAHASPGVLHRAFSVFLFDRSGRVLLQRRAMDKHHFRGRWSNTCCSHPLPGESIADAAARRLEEELGITAEPYEIGTFTYRASDPDSGLVEVEFDHVLVGRHDATTTPDPAEVAEIRWVPLSDLRDLIDDEPDAFTPWLTLALDVVERHGDVGAS